MYYRIKNGYRVDWQPEDEELAVQAMEDVKGPDPQKGVPEHVKLPEEAAVELPDAAAKNVRTRYEELYVEKYGHPIGFTPLEEEDDSNGDGDDDLGEEAEE